MIELLVVVVIMGISFTVSAGRIHDLIIQARVARVATAAQNDLEAGFAIAARNRQPIRVSWNSSTMQLNVTDNAGTLAYRSTTLGLDAYGLTTRSVRFSTPSLEIYPNGMASDTLTITIRRSRYTKHVRMSRTGLIKVDSL